MRLRGARRRRALDRGFVLSDHVDWPALLAAIEATGAERVWVTHGYREPVVRWLQERGLDAESVAIALGGRRGRRSRRSSVDAIEESARVKAFARLFAAIDETTPHQRESRRRWSAYFASAPPADAAWAVYFLSGGRPKRLIPVRRLAAWAMEEADVPEWLFDECYDAVGDLAETIALLLPVRRTRRRSLPLHRWVDGAAAAARHADARRNSAQVVLASWRELRRHGSASSGTS